MQAAGISTSAVPGSDHCLRFGNYHYSKIEYQLARHVTNQIKRSPVGCEDNVSPLQRKGSSLSEHSARVIPSERDGRALVAWNLRLLRTKLGYSQEQLASGAGVDRAYVGGLERREGNPTVEMLERLARTLSIPLAHFFVVPQAGSVPPKPMRCGRKSRSSI